MTYDVEYFIKKFEAIPECLWAIRMFHNIRTGQRCALGWCGRDRFRKTAESEALEKLFDGGGVMVVDINDGTFFGGETPKQRILSALNEIREKQLKERHAQADEVIKSIPEPQSQLKKQFV